ncbi:MAG: sortase [Oscillospiraceae bacterium]|nr:sortase [Oscillospiraceae bacterium]
MRSRIIALLAFLLILLLFAAAGLFWIRPVVIDHHRTSLEMELLRRIRSGEMIFDSFAAPAIEDENMVFPELPSGMAADDDETYCVNANGVLVVDAINLELPVAELTDVAVLRTAAGWLSVSAEAGSEGNCIIYGHHLDGYGRQFNRIDELKKGDIIFLSDTGGERYTYAVTQTVVVKPEELKKEWSKHDGKFMLTLVTDRGTGTDSHRFLVFAELDDSVG